MQRIGLSSLVALTSLAAAAASARADDRIEIGGFAGAHFFSDSLELGSYDDVTPSSPRHGLAFGPRVGYRLTSLLTLEGELSIVPTRTRGTDTNVDAVIFGWRAHALMHLASAEAPLRPYVLLGAGAMTSSSEDHRILDEDTDALFHGGAGVKFPIGDDWGLRLDGRVLLPPTTDSKFVTTDFEVLFGVYRSFPSAPKPVAVAKEAKEEAPVEVVVDADGDGITGDADQCPTEAETQNGIDDGDGCPEADDDADGVVGSQDACPTEAEDPDGFQDDDGCPDLDDDDDGLPDASDTCPREAETVNGYLDGDGCADEMPAEISAILGVVPDVRFTRRDALTAASKRALGEIAKTLVAHPELSFELRVHTDDRGDAEANRARSQRQADAAVAYLATQGVAAERLRARGMGEDEPRAPGKDKASRDQNRRVELNLVPPAAE